MDNQSKYDPSRKTVGGVYLDAQKHGEKNVQVGDMANELFSSLVTDLNEELFDLPKHKDAAQFDGRPYYVTIHEKRDLVMKNAFLRRVLRTLYRPYPEDDTLVFWRSEDRNTIKFCWQLPHWTEMDNMLASEELFRDTHREQLIQIKAWKNNDLFHFGFTKNEIGNWMANPNWRGDTELKSSFTPTMIVAAA